MRSKTILMFGVLAASATAQFTNVLPTSAAGVGGSTANAFPWGTTGTAWPGLRIMCLYDSSHFTAAPVPITYPILITSVKWRANDVATSWTGGTYTLGAQVALGTAPIDHTLASTTWATNIGPDYTIVHNGPVTVLAGTGNGVGVPGPYVVDIPVVPPFVYDPNLGDLVVDTNYTSPGNFVGGTLPGMDVHATNVNARRVYSSSLFPNANGVDTAAPVIEVGYTPASGLYSAFSANVTGGASPLVVTFTDLTYSSDPGGITSWAWDFNGDAVIDSTLQNPPPYTYTTCGDYTVSLTTTDATHPPSTFTRPAYIKTDNVVPSFTFAAIAPGVIQFTDTSVPTPTSWAWDLNGDNIVDSNLQNPVFVYPGVCSTAIVTQTVSRLCKGPFTSTQTLVLSPNTHTTLVTGGNGLSAVGSGNTFDIQVTNPQGVTICALTLCPYMGAPVIGTPLGCTVWVTDAPGGFLSNHTNAAVWRQVATGTGTFQGGTFSAPVPVVMNLSNPIYIPPGTFGMAIHMTTGCGVAYTTLTATTTYPGPDFNVICGNGKGAPFAAAANANRGWNGRIHYSTVTNGGLAGYGFFGAGCNGTLGIPSAVNATQPTIGGTLTANLTNLQFGIAVMVVGLSNTVSGGVIPLPLDLGILGAPGCPLRVSLDVTDTVVGVGTTATWNFPIPNIGGLLGFQLYNQAASIDSINAFGFVMSDAYAWVIGL